MPIYEYINPVTGERQSRLMRYAERDSIPGRQQVVPFGISGAVSRRHTQAHRVRAGLAACEERGGFKTIRKEYGYSANDMKRIWRKELEASK